MIYRLKAVSSPMKISFIILLHSLISKNSYSSFTNNGFYSCSCFLDSNFNHSMPLRMVNSKFSNSLMVASTSSATKNSTVIFMFVNF